MRPCTNLIFSLFRGEDPSTGRSHPTRSWTLLAHDIKKFQNSWLCNKLLIIIDTIWYAGLQMIWIEKMYTYGMKLGEWQKDYIYGVKQVGWQKRLQMVQNLESDKNPPESSIIYIYCYDRWKYCIFHPLVPSVLLSYYIVFKGIGIIFENRILMIIYSRNMYLVCLIVVTWWLTQILCHCHLLTICERTNIENIKQRRHSC